jgi:hypothetical protein
MSRSLRKEGVAENALEPPFSSDNRRWICSSEGSAVMIRSNTRQFPVLLIHFPVNAKQFPVIVHDDLCATY